ncbi:hypothetical protein DL767_001298 [Monosporascus sp. MG133]|nr:hypothetical protein DL767_001298 [Monosporascus sp. MG133]
MASTQPQRGVGVPRSGATAQIPLIATDRPGMGFFTYQPNRRLLDWLADLLALADQFKTEKFAVVACRAALPTSPLVGSRTDDMLLGLGSCWVWGGGRRGCSGIACLSTGAVVRHEEQPEKFDQTLDGSFKRRPAPDRAAWEADVSQRRATKSSLKEAFRHGGQGVGWGVSLLRSD